MKKGANFSMRFRLKRKSRMQILERRRAVRFLKSLKGKTPLFPAGHTRAAEFLENAVWDKALEDLFAHKMPV